MRTLLDGIPLGADEHVDDHQRHGGVAARALRGGRRRAGRAARQAHRHDPERHHQGVPLARHLRVPARAVAAADQGHHHLHAASAMPKWNPTNVCSYHLQEAGATPVQELAFALATAQAVLDAREGLRRGGARRTSARWSAASRSSSTPGCGSSPRSARCAPSRELWDEITAERYGVTDPKHRLFRYGVQVNSLGLTEPQAENNVYRILLEMLAVTLSQRRARPRRAAAGLERGARPAAALGPAVVASACSRSWPTRPTCWSIADIFEGSKVDAPQGRRAQGRGQGGAGAHRGHGRGGGGHRLHEARAGREQHRARCAGSRRASRWWSASTAGRRRRRRRCRPARAPSRRSIPAIEAEQVERLDGLARGPRRQGRQEGAGRAGARRHGRPQRHGAVDRLRQGRRHHRRVGRDAALPCSASTARRPASRGAVAAAASEQPRARCAAEVERVSARLGRRIKLLVGKPGLDGHSNGAEQIAVRARDCGMEVVYEGIRLTPGADRARRRRRGRARGRPVDPVGQPRAAGRRGDGAHARGGPRRRAGGGGRHHPAGGRRHAQGASASPPSTRPRTSSSTPSCATSSGWWTATPKPPERASAVIPAPRARASAPAEEGREPCTSRLIADARHARDLTI